MADGSTEVRVATGDDDDVAAVSRAMAEGFADDPVMSWVFGGEGRLDKLLPFFTFACREAMIPLGGTWVTGDGSGAACWTPPRSPGWPEERIGRFLQVLDAVCEPSDVERLGQLNRLMDDHHPTEPHWYLGSIATLPALRGRGVGTVLLGAGLAVVDEQGLPAYLESSNPRNVSLYLRHGFETVDVVSLPDGPPLTLMWRPATTPTAGPA